MLTNPPSLVSAVVPMRRELKVNLTQAKMAERLGFSSCPDEEGTESVFSVFLLFPLWMVSAVVPMRRELKVPPSRDRPCSDHHVSAVVPMRRELKDMV